MSSATHDGFPDMYIPQNCAAVLWILMVWVWVSRLTSQSFLSYPIQCEVNQSKSLNRVMTFIAIRPLLPSVEVVRHKLGKVFV